MFKLSKNTEKFVVNENEYRITQWSTITTVIEGKKLLMAVAPSFTAMADMKSYSTTAQESLTEIIEGGDIEFLLTGAITQLSSNFSDEHFEDIIGKLLSCVEFREKGEDDFVKIEDWSEHFDDHPEDFELVVVKSAKVNLYNFFMKQATVRSSIEKIMTVVKPLAKQLNKNTNEGMTEQ